MSAEQALALVQRYTDTWGGRNYGCNPINTPGQSLKERLDSSNLWLLATTQQHIDARGDNQCDIHRGSDFIYRNENDGGIIEVFMKKSRSGKTVAWEFHCYFAGAIEL